MCPGKYRPCGNIVNIGEKICMKCFFHIELYDGDLNEILIKSPSKKAMKPPIRRNVKPRVIEEETK